MKLTIRRVNISNANVFGLSEDLGLKGVQYNVALVIFFVPVSCHAIAAMSGMLTISPVCMFILRDAAVDPHLFWMLTLLGAIRNSSKRVDEEVHTSCMARWKYGLLRLCHDHARPGEELFWSPRYQILLGRLW
jgi:hypothetical protein